MAGTIRWCLIFGQIWGSLFLYEKTTHLHTFVCHVCQPDILCYKHKLLNLLYSNTIVHTLHCSFHIRRCLSNTTIQVRLCTYEEIFSPGQWIVVVNQELISTDHFKKLLDINSWYISNGLLTESNLIISESLWLTLSITIRGFTQ